MVQRRFTVTVPPAEAARLRAFDNSAAGRVSWPLGDNRTFRRRNRTTFEVKHYESMGVGKAMVATLGTAVLRDDAVDVTIATKGTWVGWLLVACGLLALVAVPREGIVAVALGLGLGLAGWGLFLRRPDAQGDLDAIEQVMRREIAGDWRLW